MVKAPNYLYPLATERKLQWTRDVVKGEKSASKSLRPKSFNPAKKDIVMRVVRDKKMTLRNGRPLKTRAYSNPMIRAQLPTNPMLAGDPRPANAMHLTNSKSAYLGL